MWSVREESRNKNLCGPNKQTIINLMYEKIDYGHEIKRYLKNQWHF